MHASCQWNVPGFECSLASSALSSSGFKCDQPYSRFSPSSTRDLWPFQACYCTDLRRRFAIPPSRLKALFCLGGRVHERASDSYFLPFSFFFPFLLDRRRPDVANEARRESDAADIIRKRFYQAQPLSAPFHEIFECILMVLAGKIEIPCFIVSDSLSWF